MAGAPADLAASYAAVQGNLRKQFFNDLVDLRSALLNTMHAAPPDRTQGLQVKMMLIDTALHMLEVGACVYVCVCLLGLVWGGGGDRRGREWGRHCRARRQGERALARTWGGAARLPPCPAHRWTLPAAFLPCPLPSAA